MDHWTLWLAALVASTSAAALTSYLLCRSQVKNIKTRVLLLEREISLAHIREQTEEKKLREIFKVLDSLQNTTDQLFHGLREKINQALAHGRVESYADR